MYILRTEDNIQARTGIFCKFVPGCPLSIAEYKMLRNYI